MARPCSDGSCRRVLYRTRRHPLSCWRKEQESLWASLPRNRIIKEPAGPPTLPIPFKPEFPFWLREPPHSTTVSLVRDAVKRFSSGALLTVCHPHRHSPKFPHLWPTFTTPLLTPTRCRRIPLLTGPPSTYPVGIGSSAILPSTAPDLRRFR